MVPTFGVGRFSEFREFTQNFHGSAIQLLFSKVKAEDGARIAKSWGCGFMETSAKTSHNVNELFQELLTMEKKRKMSLGILGDKKGKNSEKLKGRCQIS